MNAQAAAADLARNAALLTRRDVASLLELLASAHSTPLGRVCASFEAMFLPSDRFKACCALAVLLEDAGDHALSTTQRLAACAVLCWTYRDAPSRTLQPRPWPSDGQRAGARARV